MGRLSQRLTFQLIAGSRDTDYLIEFQKDDKGRILDLQTQ